ncbi:MAG: recombination protein RecR [Lentisphaerae bacterium RIFOXYB12_FULL_65_16]|nr:MAG: recombination protein RecR [Lentisphaerae bacterium RIFOXYA12_64_32]OGV93814.1 MAG: recombination protein RecR [Lentisphaerae bacterium RIFOXYB12_FULL_65_16]
MTTSSAFPAPLQSLVSLFRRFPGVGRRTAERLALALLEWPEADLRRFGEEIASLKVRIFFCEDCGNLCDDRQCRVCRDPSRDRQIVCVVEQALQVPIIENAGCYRGLYHVLGGRIAPLEDRGPETLRLEPLRRRLEQGEVRELILATSSDVEGEATAHFLAAEFQAYPVRITRIAAGVPVGADLTLADSATLTIALGGRRLLQDTRTP